MFHRATYFVTATLPWVAPTKTLPDPEEPGNSTFVLLYTGTRSRMPVDQVFMWRALGGKGYGAMARSTEGGRRRREMLGFAVRGRGGGADDRQALEQSAFLKMVLSSDRARRGSGDLHTHRDEPANFGSCWIVRHTYLRVWSSSRCSQSGDVRLPGGLERPVRPEDHLVREQTLPDRAPKSSPLVVNQTDGSCSATTSPSRSPPPERLPQQPA